MAYCKYCGKELPPDGKCSCPQGQTAAAMQGAGIQSGLGANPSAGITDNNDIKNAKKQRNWLGIFGALLALILVIIICIASASGGYKKPIKNFVKGLNNADMELVIDSLLPESYVESLKESLDVSNKGWKTSIKTANKALADNLDNRGIKKISVSFDGKEKVKGDELTGLEVVYKLMGGADISKAYKVSADIKIKKKGDSEEKSGYFYAVKIKGEGWKMLPFDDSFGLTDLVDLDL